MTRTTASQPRRPDAGQHAAPADRQRPVFAHDDAAGYAKEPQAPARILVVEDDFLVAADVESALLDAGFDVVGVAETAALMSEAIELRADLNYVTFALVAGFFLLLTLPIGIGLTSLSRRMAVKR